ncbi:hypothetical protein ES702_00707 [subsurface metagenome]
MKFKLIPVDSIPEYVNVYCCFNGDHEHLPIIWRNTYRSSYSGWADWGKKYAMVNFYHMYEQYITTNNFNRLIDEFLRVYYHEFIHLFFHFKSDRVYFKGKLRNLHQNEKIVDKLAILLYINEIRHIDNWADEIFKGEF